MSRTHPPALAVWSLVLLLAPFLFVAVGVAGARAERNPDGSSNGIATTLSFASQYLIVLAWAVSVVVGIVTTVARIGRWRLAGVAAMVAPVVEAVGFVVWLVVELSANPI